MSTGEVFPKISTTNSAYRCQDPSSNISAITPTPNTNSFTVNEFVVLHQVSDDLDGVLRLVPAQLTIHRVLEVIPLEQSCNEDSSKILGEGR